MATENYYFDKDLSFFSGILLCNIIFTKDTQ